MTGDSTAIAFTLPAVHALHVAELVRQWGVSAEELFAGTAPEASAEAFGVPNARIAVSAFSALVQRARALTGEPALGVHFGMRMRASAHGYLGFAAMTAATLGDALELATRFAPTRTNALSLSLRVSHGLASLAIDERADFGQARDAILFGLMFGIWQIGCALTGREADGTAEFAFPRPAYFVSSTLGQGAHRARFDQPRNQLVFDRAMLDLPLVMADAVSRRLACEQCERLLEELGQGASVLDRVRRLVLKKDDGVRSLEEIAAELHLSARTLKRKLAAQGATYTDVLDQQRREAAMRLLDARGLSLDEIAARLGYSDVANFSRAFRRWTGGASPGAYRRG
jgi:AraC-like DNA-binding protein